MLDIREVNQYLKRGAIFRGKILSQSPKYPTIYLWVWVEQECLYLAHGNTDDFSLAVTEEVDTIYELHHMVFDVAQTKMEEIDSKGAISSR